MYQYISPAGEYPRHPGDIMLENSGWNDYDNPPAGWTMVYSVEPPEIEINQKLVELYPIKINNLFYQRWQVLDMTDQEIKEANDSLDFLNQDHMIK